MTRYRAGYVVELKAKEELFKQGAALVVRSSRSLTVADLIAFFPERREIWLIQCKKKEVPKNPEKLVEKYSVLKKLEGTYTCKPYLFAKKDGRYQFIEIGGEVDA
jgi:hypothetical protein